MGDSEHTVIISVGWPVAPHVPSDFIWIQPSNLNWNDFGHVSEAMIGLVRQGVLVTKYRAKAAYFDENAKRYIGVGNAIAATADTKKNIIVTETRNVFSLAESQESYRHTIRELGVDRAGEFLRATNDLVAIAGDAKTKDIERQALASDVFKFSLARLSEAYYALKNSKPILQGLDHEDISSGPKSITITIADQNGQDVSVDFRFNHDIGIPKRTCVLIGKNGVGKSRALGNVARKALRGIQRGGSSDEDRIVASRVLAFTPGNEYTGIFPSDTRKRPATFYKRLSTSRLRHSAAGNTASASVLALSRNDREIAEKSRFGIFMDAVFAINRPEEIAFRSRTGRSYIRLAELRGSSEQRRLQLLFDIAEAVEPGRVVNGNYFHLSTGEVRFIKLLAQACMYIENGTLILLDEPETHLHPNFIARLMSALESLLSDTGSCAIIATHSVYVVREVFHDQVVIVEKDEAGRVSVKTPGMRTFGADISSISTFIFGEEGTSFLADDTIARIMKEGLSFDDVREKYGAYLSREVLSTIRDKFV